MKTFYVHTLGCKVNHYESEQVAALLRSSGLVESDAAHADLRVVNTCSVTTEAAGKSRQASRRMVRLPVLPLPVLPVSPAGGAGAAAPGVTGAPTAAPGVTCPSASGPDPRGSAATYAAADADAGVTPLTRGGTCAERSGEPSYTPSAPSGGPAGTCACTAGRPRVVVVGCWATSSRSLVAELPGVDAVITHHDDVAAELERLLELWRGEGRGESHSDPGTAHGHRDGDTSRPGRRERHAPADSPIEPIGPLVEPPPERLRNDGWINKAGLPAGSCTDGSKADPAEKVNLQIYALSVEREPENPRRASGSRIGANRLPLLGERQSGRQRAFLKIQDGCDAHCTYCIIPRLRPSLWSKPVDDAVEEARRLVAAGHVEIVLTGVFLGAYGHATALRRRRTMDSDPLAELVAALCTRVRGLRRLRLSSLEPGDLTGRLLAVLREHAQVVPHFHLPLQSGCDEMLRRMNRQYTRDDFLRMVDAVRAAFDRPALTTDVIAGFPGETDAAFGRTVEVVDRAGFIHVHAFPYSPRPGTAAARWTGLKVPGAVAGGRIDVLLRRADEHSLAFRRQFIGETVQVLVEKCHEPRAVADAVRHGRCERYFNVHFDDSRVRPGDFINVRVDAVTPTRTHGTCLSVR